MVATLERPATKKGNGHNMADAVVISKRAQEWAQHNGFRGELAGAEALLIAYRAWLTSGRPKGYDAYSATDLEKLAAKYNERLAAIQAAAQRKTS